MDGIIVETRFRMVNCLFLFFMILLLDDSCVIFDFIFDCLIDSIDRRGLSNLEN